MIYNDVDILKNVVEGMKVDFNVLGVDGLYVLYWVVSIGSFECF